MPLESLVPHRRQAEGGREVVGTASEEGTSPVSTSGDPGGGRARKNFPGAVDKRRGPGSPGQGVSSTPGKHLPGPTWIGEVL